MWFNCRKKDLENVCLSYLKYGYILYNMLSFGEVSYSIFLITFIVLTMKLFDKIEHASIFWYVGEKVNFII